MDPCPPDDLNLPVFLVTPWTGSQPDLPGAVSIETGILHSFRVQSKACSDSSFSDRSQLRSAESVSVLHIPQAHSTAHGFGHTFLGNFWKLIFPQSESQAGPLSAWNNSHPCCSLAAPTQSWSQLKCHCFQEAFPGFDFYSSPCSLLLLPCGGAPYSLVRYTLGCGTKQQCLIMWGSVRDQTYNPQGRCSAMKLVPVLSLTC